MPASPAASTSEIAVLVIGAGGHAAEICSYVADLRRASAAIRLLGCVDDHKPIGRCGPVEIIGDVSMIETLVRTGYYKCVVSVEEEFASLRAEPRFRSLLSTSSD